MQIFEAVEKLAAIEAAAEDQYSDDLMNDLLEGKL